MFLQVLTFHFQSEMRGIVIAEGDVLVLCIRQYLIHPHEILMALMLYQAWLVSSFFVATRFPPLPILTACSPNVSKCSAPTRRRSPISRR